MIYSYLFFYREFVQRLIIWTVSCFYTMRTSCISFLHLVKWFLIKIILRKATTVINKIFYIIGRAWRITIFPIPPEIATALQNQVGSRRGQPVTPSRTAHIQLQSGLLHSLQTLPPPSSVFTVCNNALSIYSKSLHMFMLLRLRKLSCKKIYYSLNFILVTFANYHIFFYFGYPAGDISLLFLVNLNMLCESLARSEALLSSVCCIMSYGRFQAHLWIIPHILMQTNIHPLTLDELMVCFVVIYDMLLWNKRKSSKIGYQLRNTQGVVISHLATL